MEVWGGLNTSTKHWHVLALRMAAPMVRRCGCGCLLWDLKWGRGRASTFVRMGMGACALACTVAGAAPHRQCYTLPLHSSSPGALCL